MAGLGIPEGSLRRPGVQRGDAGYIAASAVTPWLLAIIAVALAQVLRFGPVENALAFQAYIVYAFALSALASGPVALVAVRTTNELVFLGQLEKVPTLIVASVVTGAGLCWLLTACIGLIAGFSASQLFWTSLGTAALATIWPISAFAGSIREYSWIVWSFVLGFTLAVILSVIVSTFEADPAVEFAAFAAGLAACGALLIARILSVFHAPARAPQAALHALWNAILDRKVLLAGSALAIAVLWADKWVMWFGPLSIQLRNGLVSAPMYDSTMFLAALAMVPALAMLAVAVEGPIRQSLKGFIAAMRTQGTLSTLQGEAKTLRQQVYATLIRLLVVQACASLLLAFSSPAMADALGFRWQQVGILRLGALGSFFQFIFVSVGVLLLFLQRTQEFFWIAAFTLIAVIACTVATIVLGPQYYGYGYLAAMAIAAAVAVMTLDHTLTNLERLVFQDAVREARR
ncbi:MAG: exopolysaccharide Pel transporter PelG [Pseudomonadota bacterium]